MNQSFGDKVRFVLSEYVLPYFFLTLGSIIAAAALEEFLVPFTILDGGIVGISMILNQLTGVKLGIFTIVLNVPFLLLGWKRIGARFLFRALYSMVIFSVCLGFFEELPALTDEEILVVAFGGFTLGLGVGLILRNGGCLDGTEIVALILSRKSSMSVGQIVLLFNVVIYLAAGILFGLDRALYSLLTYFITSKVIDMVENGLDQGKAAMIITDDGRQIADRIYREMGRTCTILDGYGLVSGKKMVMYCVITRIEIPTLRSIIREADRSAFVAISDVGEIVGHHIKDTSEADSLIVSGYEE